MGYGQYCTYAGERLSKRAMLAELDEQPVTSRLVARNTMERTTANGSKIVRYHHTDVVTLHPTDAISIDTGGWNTITTRDRINMAFERWGLSPRVYSHRGAIYLVPDWTDRIEPGKSYEFTRRAWIEPNGHVSTDQERGEMESYDSLRPLVEGYLKVLKRDGVPTDCSGDPWVPVREGGKYARGDVLLWLGHKPTWLAHGEDPNEAEPYVFGTLVYHALRWSGLQDFGAAMFIEDFNTGRARTRRLVCQRVRRYLRACLGYASS